MGKRFSLETQDERVMGDPTAKERASFTGGHAGAFIIKQVAEHPEPPVSEVVQTPIDAAERDRILAEAAADARQRLHLTPGQLETLRRSE